jgi:hypothetical protein
VVTLAEFDAIWPAENEWRTAFQGGRSPLRGRRSKSNDREAGGRRKRGGGDEGSKGWAWPDGTEMTLDLSWLDVRSERRNSDGSAEDVDWCRLAAALQMQRGGPVARVQGGA